MIQIKESDVDAIHAIFEEHGILDCCADVGRLNDDDMITFKRGEDVVLENSRTYFRTVWAETTLKMQSIT